MAKQPNPSMASHAHIALYATLGLLLALVFALVLQPRSVTTTVSPTFNGPMTNSVVKIDSSADHHSALDAEANVER